MSIIIREGQNFTNPKVQSFHYGSLKQKRTCQYEGSYLKAFRFLSEKCNCCCQAWVQVQGLSQISNKRPGPGA